MIRLISIKIAFYWQTNNLIYPDGIAPFYAYHLHSPDYTKTGFIDISSGSGDTKMFLWFIIISKINQWKAKYMSIYNLYE
jgi:hypothetical protein